MSLVRLRAVHLGPFLGVCLAATVLLLWQGTEPVQAASAPSLVQTGPFRQTYSGTVTMNLSRRSTRGTLLVATVSTSSVAGVTASPGWISAASVADGNSNSSVWYYPDNPGEVLGVTFTTTGASAIAGVLTEWSGIARTSPVDGTGTVRSRSASTVSVSTDVPVAGDLAIAAFGLLKVGGGTISTTPGAGWSALPRDATINWLHFDAAYRVGGSPGVMTATDTASSPVAWSAVVVTFRASDEPGGGAIQTRPSNPVTIENQENGTTAWRLGRGSLRTADDANSQIKGYASATSVASNEKITFYVTVDTPQTISIDIYRIGWYGGLGGRLMRHIGPLDGIVQAPCPTDGTTGMITCPWSPTYETYVPGPWTSGTYLVMLTNAQGYQNYIPFVVRDGRASDLLYQQAVTTYLAYNEYSNTGDRRSLYSSPKAVKVSFDRPYGSTGAFRFVEFELPFVQYLERMGYDVTYGTDVDVHADGAGLLKHKALIVAGHNEYWSKEMFDAAEQARDAGVNLGFFGANEVYWQVRFETSNGGIANRVMVCYKSTADPVRGPTTTVRWRDAPVNRAEQQLVGIQYSSAAAYEAPSVPYVVTESSHWVFEGTGVIDGTSIPGAVGWEVDRYQPEYPSPRVLDQQVLSRSPFLPTSGVADVAESSIYQAPSGALVFAAGTIRWARKLVANDNGDERMQRITSNVLDAFIANTPIRDFALDVTPRTRAVTGGSAGTTAFHVALTNTGLYESLVALSVQSSPALPAGAQLVFSRPVLTTSSSGASATLSITLPPETPAGTYELTVRAQPVGSGAAQNVAVTVIVEKGTDGG